MNPPTDARNQPPRTAGRSPAVGPQRAAPSSFPPPTRPTIAPSRGASSNVPPPARSSIIHREMRGSAHLSTVASNEFGNAESLIATISRTSRPHGAAPSIVVQEEKGVRIALDENVYPEGGWRAWKVVFGAFIFTCCQMGYGQMFGVVLTAMHTTRFKDQPISVLTLIVGLSNLMCLALSFVAGRLGDVYGYKIVIAAGVLGVYISLILSSLAGKTLALVFVFQGLFLGTSMCTLSLYMAMPSQWFKQRRGLATGIVMSGSGVGGAISSLIVRGLIPRIGYEKALLVYGSINFVVCIGAWFLLEVRELPAQQPSESESKTWLPEGIWKDGAWYSLLASFFFGVFGFLSPFYLLTQYTQVTCPHLDPSSIIPALPLVVLNIAGGLGRIFAGLLADYVGPVNGILISFFFGATFQMVIWPFADTYAKIMAFAVLYGLVGTWFMSLLPPAAAQLFGMNQLATTTGAVILANAPGQFVGATISGLILSATNGNYKAVAWYSGGFMMIGAVCLVYARFSRAPSIWTKF